MAEEQLQNPEENSAEVVEADSGVEQAQKPPFAEGDVSLSGMVSSVLNPLDDKERQRVEREIKKRQERLEKFNIVFLKQIVHIFRYYFGIGRNYGAIIMIGRGVVLNALVVDAWVKYKFNAAVDKPFDMPVHEFGGITRRI